MERNETEPGKLTLPGKEMNTDKVRNCVKRVFASDEGAVVLEYLAEYAHADSAEYCNDPRKDAYLQGRRSVVLEIRRIIKEKMEDE